MPERILDLFTEFRVHTNMGSKIDQDRRTPNGAGLLGALTYFGIDSMGATEKKEIQKAIGAGAWHGHYTPKEILHYCETDVAALDRHPAAVLPQNALPRPLLRGR